MSQNRCATSGRHEEQAPSRDFRNPIRIRTRVPQAYSTVSRGWATELMWSCSRMVTPKTIKDFMCDARGLQ